MSERAQRKRDRVAMRTFEKLRANPSSYRSAPSTWGAAVFSACVLLGAAAAVAALAWATIRADGAVEWFLVALGWAVVLVVRPRRHRLPDDVRVLRRADHPGIWELVDEMARAVGVEPPDVVAVDLAFNAYVTPIGWGRRDALVLGLPLMSLGTWHERAGTIGHELGHLRGRDTLRLRLVAAADRILNGAEYLVAPDAGFEDRWARGSMADESSGNGFFDDLARWVQALLALPFQGLSRVLDRLDLASSQHLEYLADRRSAEVVGSEALAQALLRDLEGIRTATAAAARRDQDPFAALLARPALSSAQQEEHLRLLEAESARADDTHPLDHLRVKLVRAAALLPSPVMPVEATCRRAESELVELREVHRKAFADELVYDL